MLTCLCICGRLETLLAKAKPFRFGILLEVARELSCALISFVAHHETMILLNTIFDLHPGAFIPHDSSWEEHPSFTS